MTTCVATWGKTKCMVLIFVFHRLFTPFKDQYCMITHRLICVTVFKMWNVLQRYCWKERVRLYVVHVVNWSCAGWPTYQKSSDFMSVISIPEGSCVLSICPAIIYLFIHYFCDSFLPVLNESCHSYLRLVFAVMSYSCMSDSTQGFSLGSAWAAVLSWSGSFFHIFNWSNESFSLH